MQSYWQQVVEIGKLIPRDELKGLLAPSNLRGWMAVATTYAMIAFSLGLVYFWPSILSVVVALILIGGRQLALAILTHEAVHKTLFASKPVNEWVGKWLCAYPMGIDLLQYRAEHMVHHQKTGTPEDPDLGLVTPYPVSKGSLSRKFLRDLSGVTGIKRAYFIWLMASGVLTYTLSTNAKPIDQTDRGWGDRARALMRNLGGTVTTHLLFFTVLFFLGAPLLYLLWIAAYLSTFSLFLRVRSIAEHACTPDKATALLNTRTTHAGPFARLIVAPHRVNYHLEHHLFMQVPYFHLPALHRLLDRHGILKKACTARGYFEVLRLAAASR
jgi:fatty acid desaturase